MDQFRNINYPYKTQDDTFIARGLQLNTIVDEINSIVEGYAEEIVTTTLSVSGVTTLAGSVTLSGLGSDDTEDHVVAIDDATGLLSKRSVASITPSLWSKTSTNLSPATPGDELLLPANDKLAWQGGAGYITGGDTSVSIYTNNAIRFSLGITDVILYSGNIRGGSTKAVNLGTTSHFFDNAYVDTLYIDDVNTYIDIAGGDMTFTDTNSGTITLASLVAGAMVYPAAGIALSTGAAWSASITNNSANWNTAYGWGNHAGLYDPTGTASAAVSSHESTYNHTNYNTAYAHVSLTNNPHAVDETDILPSQATHSGKFLTTNGSVSSWAVIAGAGTVTNVSSTTTNQLTVANPTTTPALTIATAAVANAETALATGDQIYDFVIGLGYSTTVGTVTSVAAGNGLSFTTITASGSVTLGTPSTVTSSTTNSVTASSHTHALGSIDAADITTGITTVSRGGTGLGTVATSRMLTGNGTSALTAEANCTFTGSLLAVTGAITATGEITAYSSDRRLKTNIVRIPNPLEKVEQLDGVTYDWNMEVCNKVGFKPARRHETGMIAQNLGSVISDAITFAPFDRNRRGYSKSGKDYLTVNLEKVIPLLVEAVKELTDRNEKLVERVRQLENN